MGETLPLKITRLRRYANEEEGADDQITSEELKTIKALNQLQKSLRSCKIS